MKSLIIAASVSVGLIIAACIFLAVEPSGKLLGVVFNNPFICFGYLFLVAVVFMVVLSWIDAANASKLSKSRPKFFEEMQSILRSTLLPLGFAENEERVSWIRESKYSRDEFVVSLTTHIADQEYSLSASSNSIQDFLVGGALSKPDEFKSQALAKLNEWLIKKQVSL